MSLKRIFSRLVPQTVKNVGYHLPLAVGANIWFGFPSRNMTVVGITGTNGKTTTTKMVAALLTRSGKKVAFASTIEYGIGEKHWVNASKFTTASAWQLQKFLHEAKEAGVTHVVLETSSHSLHQFRTWGIPYHVATITNVTREHLDYHQTMSEYRAAKRLLFDRADRAVVNADMENPEEYFLKGEKRTITYSTKNPTADVFAQEIEIDFSGTRFLTLGTSFRIRLPGLFNVENALAAIATGMVLGIETGVIREALSEIISIPGRMELVENARGLDILVDYAVTPDSFEKLYATVKPLQIPGTKIVHVFGACGERDRGKRPMLGKIASENADIIILTNEDPYHEDPEQIIDEIESGIEKKKDYYRIFDRREAIRKALEIGEQGDIILITGKGAEETMAIGDRRVPWKERKVIHEELDHIDQKSKEKAAIR